MMLTTQLVYDFESHQIATKLYSPGTIGGTGLGAVPSTMPCRFCSLCCAALAEAEMGTDFLTVLTSSKDA